MILGMQLEKYDLSHVHLASMTEGTKSKHRRKTDKMIKKKNSTISQVSSLANLHLKLHSNTTSY